MSREIRQDGSTLKDGEIIAVVVNNGRDPPIRTDFSEPRLFLNILHNVDALKCIILAIGLLQLLEQNGSFVAIGSSESEKLDAGFGDQACWPS